MSDSLPTQRQAGKRTPKRQDWLPNRMFDPVNNPFAVQNLLAREQENEDAAFAANTDGRADPRYAGNQLLKDAAVLPSKAFTANRLLEEQVTADKEFFAEYVDEDEEDQAALPTAPVTAEALVPEHDALAPGEHSVPALEQHPLLEQVDAPAILTSALAPSRPEPEQAITHDEDHDEDKVSSPVVDAAEPTPDQALAENKPTLTDSSTPEAASLAAEEASAHDAAIAEQAQAVMDEGQSSLAKRTDDPEGLTVTDTVTDTADEADSNLGAKAAAEEKNEHADIPELAAQTALADQASEEQSSELPADQANDTSAEAQYGLSSEAIDQLLQQAREQARQEAREAAYQEGLQAGIEQAKAELQQSIDLQQSQLRQLIDSLQHLTHNPDSLFEPMKTLAVHLAEELVRGELAQSPQTISRLVDNCMRELAASGEKAVIIHLNPEDLEQYKPLIAAFGDSIVLRPDALLARGSVRASLDGSVVEDLIDRRVKGIKKSLAQPVASGWRQTVANPLAQRAQPEPVKAVAEQIDHSEEEIPDAAAELASTEPTADHAADVDAGADDLSTIATAATETSNEDQHNRLS